MYKPLECLRALIRDMVANSQSGHIGMSLGASSLVYTLYRNVLNVSPNNPDFINRDRLVYSAGHCTPLIYAILHLSGYDITLDDLKKFRMMGSPTTGHPEIQTCGVDCSSGALGQGIANAVGLAIAERHLASVFNKPDIDLINHYTYVICGEGCLMEGVSYEAISLAGELKLNKLIAFYDCNQITLDGTIENVFEEDISSRFESLGWNVLEINECDNIIEITNAIDKAKLSDKPTLVIVPSILGIELLEENTNKAHSCIIDEYDARKYREKCGLPTELFNIPQDMYNFFYQLKDSAYKMEYEYAEKLKAYKRKYKKDFEKFERYIQKDFKFNLKIDNQKNCSGVDCNHEILNSLSDEILNIVGGCADVASSTKAVLNNSRFMTKIDYSQRNIHFGVREFCMACVSNGIAIHGGLLPFCSTFLAFSDYMKPAIRMSAMMRAKVLYIFTNDDLHVGKDGASHEPVEQIDMLRSIPHLQVFRPCCIQEIKYAYEKAYEYFGPTVIILSKEKLINLDVNEKDMKNGIYCISKSKRPIANIFASGNDIKLALNVKKEILQKGLDVNVYSILKMNDEFEKIKNIKTNCVIECSSAYTLQSLVGDNGMLVCVRDFGLSGEGCQVYKKYGFDEKIISEKLINLSKKNGDCIESMLY